MNDEIEQIDDGGPAFPAMLPVGNYCTPGMSLCDWFAGQAIGPLIHLMQKGLLKDAELPDGTMGQIVASQAYGIANDMLAERERRYAKQS